MPIPPIHRGSSNGMMSLPLETPPILPFRLLAHAGHQSTIVASLAPHRRINASRLAHLNGLGNPPYSPRFRFGGKCCNLTASLGFTLKVERGRAARSPSPARGG